MVEPPVPLTALSEDQRAQAHTRLTIIRPAWKTGSPRRRSRVPTTSPSAPSPDGSNAIELLVDPQSDPEDQALWHEQISLAFLGALQPLHQRSKENGSETPVAQPRPQLQNLLDRYMTLWQQADVPGLVALLREDAWLTMPPLPAWFRDERILLLCSGSGSSLPANNGGCCQRAPMAARLSGSIGGKVGKTADSRLPCGSWGWKANRSAASLCSWM
jgi:hypothetical protein